MLGHDHIRHACKLPTRVLKRRTAVRNLSAHDHANAVPNIAQVDTNAVISFRRGEYPVDAQNRLRRDTAICFQLVTLLDAQSEAGDSQTESQNADC
jgi:hypothetical protein